jgi:hypothetical protein
MAAMDLNSRALRGAQVIAGKARWTQDSIVVERPVMALTARRFVFEAAQNIEIEGFTMLPAPYADPDMETPTLNLDGQRFFDRRHSEEPFPALAIIGGPPAPSPSGFAGNSAHVAAGPGEGGPVRPFVLEGADAPLKDAVRSFLGWKEVVSMEGVRDAIGAGHPLIAVDALRICADSGAADEFQALAAHLLHPTQPPEAKAIALRLVARRLERLQPGSAESDALVALTSRAWRFERQHRVAEGYLDVWSSAPEQVKRAPSGEEVIAMALDETAADRLRDMQRKLREGTR